MKELGRYDKDLQMFVETPHPVNLGRLRFMRFIAERDGRTVSDPAGDLALAAVIVKDPTPAVTMRRTIVQGD